MAQKYYTVAEISKAIGVSCSTVVKWINAGNLEARFDSSHAYLIEQKDLAAFVINPPGTRARGIVALVDKNTLEQLTGKNERERKRKKHYRRGYWASARAIGWVLP